MPRQFIQRMLMHNKERLTPPHNYGLFPALTTAKLAIYTTIPRTISSSTFKKLARTLPSETRHKLPRLTYIPLIPMRTPHAKYEAVTTYKLVDMWPWYARRGNGWEGGAHWNRQMIRSGCGRSKKGIRRVKST